MTEFRDSAPDETVSEPTIGGVAAGQLAARQSLEPLLVSEGPAEFQEPLKQEILLSLTEDNRLLIGENGRPSLFSRTQRVTRDRTQLRMKSILNLVDEWQVPGHEFIAIQLLRSAESGTIDFSSAEVSAHLGWLRSLKTPEGERIVAERRQRDYVVMKLDERFRLVADPSLRDAVSRIE